MARLLFTLASLLILLPSTRVQAKEVVIRWHGQSFFEIISPEGLRIVLDPHAIEEYGRNSVQADLILMSHFHNDHTQVGVVENASKVRQINALKKVERPGAVPTETWNLVDEKIKDVHIRTVGTYHDTMAGLKRGKNGIWILEMAGLRIVHLGDLGHVLRRSQVRQIGPVDVLLIPIGGVYTINGLDAQRVCEQLKPRRYILPMHYGTDVYDALLDLDKSLFLDDQEIGKVQKFPTTNELKIDPEAPVPEEPTIAILYWKKRGS
jgi:L-ascorbate metabolism protein UlaG (beta-lactamase superfamily)